MFGPMTMAKPPYQWDKVFAPVSSLAFATNMLLVRPTLPVKTVAELIDYSKKNPGKLTLATSGGVSINHFLAELLKLKTGITWTEVHYRGNAPAITDLMAGHVDVGFQQLTDSPEHIKAGRLRALAVLGPQRADALPDVPTHRRGRLSRGAGHHLQRHLRAEGNAAGRGRQAQRRDPHRVAEARGDRQARRPRLRGAAAAHRRSSAKFLDAKPRSGPTSCRRPTSRCKVNSPAANTPPRRSRRRSTATIRTPKLKLPPGACDCHFHFIGPQKQFTLKPNHVFSHLEFEDTTFEDWEKMQAALGLSARACTCISMMYEHNYEIAPPCSVGCTSSR